jgi:hypothetical protein
VPELRLNPHFHTTSIPTTAGQLPQTALWVGHQRLLNERPDQMLISDFGPFIFLGARPSKPRGSKPNHRTLDDAKTLPAPPTANIINCVWSGGCRTQSEATVRKDRMPTHDHQALA